MGELTLYAVCSICGDMTFALVGWNTARMACWNRVVWILSGLSTCFFGGALLRDTLTLQITPVIVQTPDKFLVYVVLLTLLSCFWQDATATAAVGGRECVKFSDGIVTAMDSLGIVSFARAGYDIAVEVGRNANIAVLCGVFTAIGGGVIASCIRSAALEGSEHFVTTVRRNVPYYLYAAAITLAYGALLEIGVARETAFNALILPSVVLGLLAEEMKRGLK